MGSIIEINDTLKIPIRRGFPAELTLERHTKDPASSEKFMEENFLFWNKGRRLYHLEPTPVRLVQEIEGQWLYWGHAHILQLTLGSDRTEGIYRIVKLYTPEEQRVVTMVDAPMGKSFFK